MYGSIWRSWCHHIFKCFLKWTSFIGRLQQHSRLHQSCSCFWDMSQHFFFLRWIIDSAFTKIQTLQIIKVESMSQRYMYLYSAPDCWNKLPNLVCGMICFMFFNTFRLIKSTFFSSDSREGGLSERRVRSTQHRPEPWSDLWGNVDPLVHLKCVADQLISHSWFWWCASVFQGFICPQCMKSHNSAEELFKHYELFHDTGDMPAHMAPTQWDTHVMINMTVSDCILLLTDFFLWPC